MTMPSIAIAATAIFRGPTLSDSCPAGMLTSNDIPPAIESARATFAGESPTMMVK